MVLPKFLEKIFKKGEKETKYYLVLLFNEEKIKAAVFKKEGNKGVIIGFSEVETRGDWEEIVKSADLVITKASNEVPQEQIKEVIFGIPSSWVENNKIKESYLLNLKKLASDLSLDPIGFIVKEESLVHYLSKKEGAPITAVIIGFKKKSFSLLISSVGKILGIGEGSFKEGVFLCEEILRVIKERFSAIGPLPSKIVLYGDTQELETIKQELLSYPWLTKANFLHFPKIEIQDSFFDLNALVFSATTEMGINLEKEIEQRGEEEKHKLTGEDFGGREKLQSEETKKKEIISEVEDFGFVKDKDIAEEVGLMVSDLTKTKGGEEEKLETQQKEKPFIENTFKIKSPFSIFPALSRFSLNLGILEKFKDYKLFILVPFVLILIFLLIYWYFLLKAEVVLFVLPKTLEKEEIVLVDSKVTIFSTKEKKIPGFVTEVTEKGTKTIKTTGKKIVGEKARGEVTIFNKTNYPKKFSSGTIIFGPNNLRFSLDEDVTVASQSSSVSSDESVVLTPGKAKVKVTALEIGSEANLPKNTEFKIADYSTSDFKAKNEEEAFSGGVSREVSVVSSEDQDKLLSLLTNELLKRAKSEMKNKVKEGMSLIEESLESKIRDKKFNKKLGEEANEITLELSLDFKAILYNQSDLEELLLQVLTKTVPQGYDYRKEKINVEIKEVKKEKNKGLTLKVFCKVNLLPKIDIEKVKRDLAGKNFQVASSYLEEIPGVVGFTSKITPRLPGFLYTFPVKKDNIKIEVRIRSL